MFGLGCNGGDGCGSLLMLLLLLQCCNRGNECECDCHDDCLGGDIGGNCCNSGGFGGDFLMWIILLKCLCR